LRPIRPRSVWKLILQNHDAFSISSSSVVLSLIALISGRFRVRQNLPNTTRLLRFPTTNGDQIVFCYAGELYTVAKEGGTARRLTSGPATARFRTFRRMASNSPSPRSMTATPRSTSCRRRRRTETPHHHRHSLARRHLRPDGAEQPRDGLENTQPLVVFRSRRTSFNSFIGDLETVGMNAELPKQLPVPRGGFVSFAPDDSKMAFNRVFREFRTWKHYRGGMADDVWVYDFKTQTTENLTNNPSQDICPMWGADNRIYFPLRPRRPDESFAVDLASKETEATHELQRFRHQVPDHRQGRDRL
jgi:tricorn protease